MSSQSQHGHAGASDPATDENAPEPSDGRPASACHQGHSHNSDDSKGSEHTQVADQPDAPVVPAEASDTFKEGGYGWVVVLAVFLFNAHTWGLNSAYAIFLAYYLRHDIFSGASDLEFAFVGGLSISIAMLVSPLATASIGHFGTRITLLIGIFFETLALIGASFTSRIWHLLLSQGIAFGIGMGFIFVASVGIIPQFFSRRRSFANAVGSSGSGFGGLAYALGTNALIHRLGLPWALRVLACIACVVNLVSTALVRDRNRQVGAVHAPFSRDLFRDHSRLFAQLLLLLWSCLSMFGYIIVVFSLSAYAESVGRSAAQGSLVAALFNLSQGIGRPLLGLASDPIGRINIAGLSTLVAGVAALLIWILAGSSWAGLVIYSLFGGFTGILWAAIAPVTAEIVGLALLPAAFSVLWLSLVGPATVAEAIGLALRTHGPHAYLPPQLFAGFCYIGAFLSIWLLRGWKMHQLEQLTAETPEQRTSLARFLLRGRWIYQWKRV